MDRSGKKSIQPRIIIGVFIVFALFLISSTLIMSSRKVDMVTDNYYSKEMNYEARVEQIRRSRALEYPVEIIYEDQNQRLIITFPAMFLPDSIKGDIHIYRPSDAGMDNHYAIAISEKGSQTISTRQMAKGRWRVNVAWRVGRVEFFDEGVFAIL